MLLCALYKRELITCTHFCLWWELNSCHPAKCLSLMMTALIKHIVNEVL